MKLLLFFSSLLAICCQYVEGKDVFAHFMVMNSAKFTSQTWTTNIDLAMKSKIDGFAMNMAFMDSTNEAQLPVAFQIARNMGFKLFFSFDYAANGVWSKSAALKLLEDYIGDPAYFRDRGTNRPLVSTFEGRVSENDWKEIKTKTNCFFVPSWNTLTPKEVMSKNLANGLFNWDAWPEGKNEMFTTLDIVFKDALAPNKRPYMMPVSPWFYTNMPGYRKNWVWQGDSLWYDRWNHIFRLQPEYVQIISWNDFGESHYIGPLDTNQFTAFDSAHGNSPYNYANNMPHDGWRATLPYVIEMYKNGQSTITQEKLVVWYRRTSALAACSSNGTTGNTAAKCSAATFTVSIGGVMAANPTWDHVPVGGIGIYHGSVAFNSKSSGDVWTTIYRNGVKVPGLQFGGQPILLTCTQNIKNYNAYVKAATSTVNINKTPQNHKSSVCVEGTGPGKYLEQCRHSCKYGYCPPVCTCTMMGPQITLPPPANKDGCPKTDSTFKGLCAFNCNTGYCSTTHCTTVPLKQPCPAAPDPIPPNTMGTALGEFASICNWSCRFNKCPPEICYCTSAGLTTGAAPPITSPPGWSMTGVLDYGLCSWVCERGFCPYPCTNTGFTKFI